MYGFEAIQASNGWAMAITGAIIVMVGLTILSFIISQLHRIIDFVDNRKSRKLNARNQAEVSEPQPVLPSLSDLSETMNHFKPLTQKMGEPFDLTALFQIFIHHGDPHPHLTIRSLREQGYLISTGEGLFSWKHQ